MTVFMYGSETVIWREKERSGIRVVQMNNLRGQLGMRRMDKVLNAQIRELSRVMKGVNENIDKGFLLWFGHVEGMENDRIAKRVYVEECAGSLSMGRP